MDPFHERLARIALDAAGIYSFALAGGYAIQAHGFLSRCHPMWTCSLSRPIGVTGFDLTWFAEWLAAIDRLPDSLFQPYGLEAKDVTALRLRMTRWAARIRDTDAE